MQIVQKQLSHGSNPMKQLNPNQRDVFISHSQDLVTSACRANMATFSVHLQSMPHLFLKRQNLTNVYNRNQLELAQELVDVGFCPMFSSHVLLLNSSALTLVAMANKKLVPQSGAIFVESRRLY